MSETIERSAADRALTLRNILADLRLHQVEGVDAAEIREAIEHEEQIELDKPLPWACVALMGFALAVLLALWCRGII